MSLKDNEDRWFQMLAQAQRFADTDNTTDAAARARLVLEEVNAALATATEGTKVQLQRWQTRAEREAARFRELHQAWQAEVRARKEAFETREANAYNAPLPVK